MSNSTYCVKCRKKTNTTNETSTKTKNNRPILQGICIVCGSRKSAFIGYKSGKGLFNKALTTVGNIVGEMHLPAAQGEYQPDGSFNNQKKYSYCGPGTKYEQRVREGYEGINELDRMCKLHDQFYNENPDTSSRNISDYALANRAKEIANDPGYDKNQRWWADKVSTILQTKAKFGLGIDLKDSKNVKKGPAKKK